MPELRGTPVTAADVSVGMEIPTFERMSSLHAWNRFAAVNEEFVPIHMDDEAGKNAGNGGAFGMGALQFSYLHALLRQWIGDDGRIVAVSLQYRSPNLRGLMTTARATVTAIREENGETLVDLDVRTETAEGTTLAPGKATVALAG
jgi:acyl dehydratase